MLNSLTLVKFRNFEFFDTSFNSKSVIFQGGNGQGKTSLLESIFYLSNLRSFRTSRIRELKKIGSDYFRISANLRADKWNSKIETEYTGNVRKLKIDNEDVKKASDFIGKFNTIAFLPDDPSILTGQSALRRRFFDMFISMLDPKYFISLQTYSSALKARNFILKSKSPDYDVLDSYTPLLSESGSYIIGERLKYTEILSKQIQNILSEIRPELSNFSIRMKYLKESEHTDFLRSKLNLSLERDIQRGFTLTGPHIDDFDFIVDDKNLRLFGSRGQCRITSFALKLAEFEIVKNNCFSKKQTVVIVDDATGDLDPKAKNSFFEKIRSGDQIFCAFTDAAEQNLLDNPQIIRISNGARQDNHV